MCYYSSMTKNFEKLKEIIKYVIKLQGGKVYTKIRLMKLLYILDREYFKKIGESLTGVDYKNYFYGPYSSQITNALNELEKEGVVTVEKKVDILEDKEFYIITLNSHNFELSKEEMSVIREILSPYLHKSLQELLDDVYGSSEFSNTPFGEVIKFSNESRSISTPSK